MWQTEYDNACEKILSSTLQYINFEHMKKFDLDRKMVQTDDPIYAGTVCDSAPVTLAYTPAGSGKSKLIADRARALISAGILPQQILVLNMNIAKCKQMSAELPGVNVMTFNDFIHGLFAANMPGILPSDLESVAASLTLLENMDPGKMPLLPELIRKMSEPDPQKRNVLLTLFVNAHIDFVADVAKLIGKADSAMESMICQNRTYRFASDPYEAESILINGVQNMPLPALCTLVQYASVRRCNLFFTGSPKETIYEFSMAYGKAMDLLSSHDGKGLHLIRLGGTANMPEDIRKALDMDAYAKIDKSILSIQEIDATHGETMGQILEACMGKQSGWLPGMLSKKERVLVLARSKQDLNDILSFLEKEYGADGIKIGNISDVQPPSSIYGRILSQNYGALRERYGGGIAMGQLFMELYEIMNRCEQETEDRYVAAKTASAKNSLLEWANVHNARFNGLDVRMPLVQAIQTVTDIESEDIQAYMKNLIESDAQVTDGLDIVLATIHASVDIRMDNVLVFSRISSAWSDTGLYRVALSRARKAEKVVFACQKRVEHPMQKYLRTHIA